MGYDKEGKQGGAGYGARVCGKAVSGAATIATCVITWAAVCVRAGRGGRLGRGRGMWDSAPRHPIEALTKVRRAGCRWGWSRVTITGTATTTTTTTASTTDLLAAPSSGTLGRGGTGADIPWAVPETCVRQWAPSLSQY